MHEQVVVKVNAPVDKGGVPLVEALNGFDCVITLDSCEHGVTGASYVYFLYGIGLARTWTVSGMAFCAPSRL